MQNIKWTLKSDDYVKRSDKMIRSTSKFLHHPQCTTDFFQATTLYLPKLARYLKHQFFSSKKTQQKDVNCSE